MFSGLRWYELPGLLLLVASPYVLTCLLLAQVLLICYFLDGSLGKSRLVLITLFLLGEIEYFGSIMLLPSTPEWFSHRFVYSGLSVPIVTMCVLGMTRRSRGLEGLFGHGCGLLCIAAIAAARPEVMSIPKSIAVAAASASSPQARRPSCCIARRLT